MSSSKIHVGIDPGKKGAIVWLRSDGEYSCYNTNLETDPLLRTALADIVGNKRDFNVWCERVPKYDGKNQSGSSVATLFSSYRYIVGYLEGKGVTVNLVVPQVWMKPHRIACEDWPTLTYPRRKSYLYACALQRFFREPPRQKIWENIGEKGAKLLLPRQAADAALIALHGYNQYKANT